MAKSSTPRILLVVLAESVMAPSANLEGERETYAVQCLEVDIALGEVFIQSVKKTNVLSASVDEFALAFQKSKTGAHLAANLGLKTQPFYSMPVLLCQISRKLQISLTKGQNRGQLLPGNVAVEHVRLDLLCGDHENAGSCSEGGSGSFCR